MYVRCSKPNWEGGVVGGIGDEVALLEESFGGREGGRRAETRFHDERRQQAVDSC